MKTNLNKKQMFGAVMGLAGIALTITANTTSNLSLGIVGISHIIIGFGAIKKYDK